MPRAATALLFLLGVHTFPIAVRAFDDATPPLEATPVGYTFEPTRELSFQKGGFRIVPYGFVWANMAYATQRTVPGPFTLFVSSEQQQGEAAFNTDARRSRIGVDVLGPDIPIAGGLKSTAQIELDFLGEFVNENQGQARLRQAYWEGSNDHHRFLVGQTWDVISPLRPRTVNFSVGWLGGNIGFRRAQFRYERFGGEPDGVAWTLQTSLNQDITPDFVTDPGVIREPSSYPVIEARAALTWNKQAGKRATTLGFSGHFGETGFDFRNPGPPPLNLPPLDDARFHTWSFNVDLAIPLGQRAHVQAEFFHGQNLSPFLGGIGQGVCACTRTAITSTGGWIDLQYECTDRLTTHVGYGLDDPVNDDLQLGRNYNQFIFANAMLAITDALTTGLEATYWKTGYQDRRAGLIPADQLGPTAPGKALVIDWMVKYDF